MKDYRAILRRVGWVLIIVGLIDIGFMIYCISNNRGYHSSFNIFAVIAGVYLLRSNLKAARIISFFTAFLIVGISAGFLFTMFQQPFDLLLTSIKLKPLTTIPDFMLTPIIIALLVLVYRSLTSETVVAAIDAAQLDRVSFWRKPARGFWIGGCVAILTFVFISVLPGGTTVDQAKKKAAAQVGAGYKFYVRSMSSHWDVHGKRVCVVVTAYNDHEIKNIVVQWSE